MDNKYVLELDKQFEKICVENDRLRTANAALVEALKLIERACPLNGERMAHQDYAKKTLAKHGGKHE